MKPIALLLALALCALLGCSVNDDPVYSPVYPCPSFSDARPASAMPDDGNSDANGRAGDPSNDDPTAIDAGESHAGRYVGDYGVSVPTDNRPRDVKMLELNCRKLEAAVDEFAKRTGRYPEDVDADRTPGGKTVIDLLPDDHLLSDPYGRARRAPVSHSAVLTGEIGYAMVHEERGWTPGTEAGYVITARTRAFGCVAYSNLDYPMPELVVLSHARTLQIAVERFAKENDGVYPCDISSDATPEGHRAADFLPEGCLLENPMTRGMTEPVDGSAANPGEIGLCPVICGGVARGYVITGVGRVAGANVIVIARDTCMPHAE